jgi:hypothetical protein
VSVQREGRARLMRLDSVEWAQHIALRIERELRRIEDEEERQRLRRLRDSHFAQMSDEQIKRGDA